MKNLLLLLVLINLLAFAYQRWIIAPDAPVAAQYLEQSYPGLALVPDSAPPPAAASPATPAGASGAAAAAGDDEADDAAAAAAAATGSAGGPEAAAAAPVAPVARQRCVRIGPFAREGDAEPVRAALQRQGATVSQSSEEGRVWVGHWVQVSGLDSRPQAEAARQKLAAAGMTDAYIVTTDAGLRISLGVFRSRSSADRTVQQARRLGFRTLIEERYQPGLNIWLRAQLNADVAFRPGDLQNPAGQILRTETVSCGE